MRMGLRLARLPNNKGSCPQGVQRLPFRRLSGRANNRKTLCALCALSEAGGENFNYDKPAFVK
jgi:hypothetical protein